MHTTWYVLEDGSAANPDEVAPSEDGKLRHKGGVAVAYGPHGPRSRCMNPSEISARIAPPARDRQMKAKPAARYETR